MLLGGKGLLANLTNEPEELTVQTRDLCPERMVMAVECSSAKSLRSVGLAAADGR